MRILQALSLYLLLVVVCTKSQKTLHSIPMKSIQSKVEEKYSLGGQTNAVSQLCSTYTNRYQLVNLYDIKVAKDYMNSINSSLDIDGLSVLKLIANSQGSAAWDIIQKNLFNVILFVSTFGVGLVVLLLSWPFLLCFCLCNCCKSKRSKGSENMLLILFLLGLTTAVGTSIYGLIQTLDTGDSIKRTGCAVAIIPNDLLFGNKTNDGKSFFSGFLQISGYIISLQDNLVNISKQFSTLAPGSQDPTFDNALQLIQTSKADTVRISNNDAIGSDLVIGYPSPINESTSIGTVSSIFPSILGSYSSQSGIIWAIYQALSTLDSTLQDLRTSAVEFNNEITNLNNGILEIQTQALTIIQDINDSEIKIEDYLSQVQNAIKYSDLGIKVYYGVVISFSALAMLAAFLTTKFHSCRSMIPITCVVLFFAAFIGFVLSVAFTIVIPPLTWSCTFIQDSLTSQANFQSNFGFLIDKQTLQEISVCMPYGNGDIVSKIGIDAVAGLNNLTQVINTLNTFQIDQYKGPILQNIQQSVSVISDFAQSRIIDISDSSTLALLAKISNPSLYFYQNCNQLLKNDSWVPSNQPNTSFSYISCTSSIGKSGDQVSCPNGIINVDPCTGCMDTGSLSNFYYRYPASNLLNDLNTRYTPSCTFNSQLNNIWQNYYLLKAKALGPDVQGVASTSGVLPRMMTVKNDINLLINSIDPALPNVFNNILRDLSDISNLIDPKYGLIAGLNCKLMGEDFQRLEQATCGSIYSNIYITRLVLGISSYGILLSLCLAVPLSKKKETRPRVNLEESSQDQHRSLNEPFNAQRNGLYSEQDRERLVAMYFVQNKEY